MGGGKISAGKLNAPKHVLCVRVTRITGDNRLCKLPAFLRHWRGMMRLRAINHYIRITWGQFESFVKLARRFLKAGFR